MITNDQIYQELLIRKEMLDLGINIGFLLAAMILVQVLIQVWLFYPVYKASKENRELLKMAEKHGQVTDSQNQRMELTLRAATQVMSRANVILGKLETSAIKVAEQATANVEEVKAAVGEVPARTADLVAEKIGHTTGTGGGSSVNLGQGG